MRQRPAVTDEGSEPKICLERACASVRDPSFSPHHCIPLYYLCLLWSTASCLPHALLLLTGHPGLHVCAYCCWVFVSGIFWWAVWSQTSHFTKFLPLLFQLCLCILLISLHEMTLLHNIISATGVLWACLKVTIGIIAVSVKLTAALARTNNF